MNIRNIFAAFALILTIAACTPATIELPPQQIASLQTRVDSFEKAFLSKDYSEIISVTPPPVVASLASRAGIAPKVLRTELINQMRKGLQVVPLVSYGMSVENASFHATTSGRPYALVPTQTVVRLPNGSKLQSVSQTLAFQDKGVWYLVRLAEGPQLKIFQEVYPEFKGVKVPKASTRTIS